MQKMANTIPDKQQKNVVLLHGMRRGEEQETHRKGKGVLEEA